MSSLATFPPAGAEWTFLVVIGVILVAPILFERVLRLPGMVGLLIGGMLIGPNVLDWVVDQEAVGDIGELGLLFLMFIAGVELDLDDFARHRSDAIRFGLLTFSLPLVLGIAVGALGFGYGAAAAVLFGSLWASHTLVAYPIVRQNGVASSRPVSMTVGGTVITDTSALFVLAVVVGANAGDGRPSVIVLGLLVGLAVLVGFTLIVLPRAMRWFFAGLGQDRLLRFLAVVVALLAAAMVAHVGGLEAIVGAFFAGLGLNRLVPNRGPLMDRIEFAGSALLIPFFLVSTGMRLDPASLTDTETIALALASLAVVVVGKAAAAVLAGRSIRATRPEIAVVFSLSVAQAAATLAAVVIGLEAGIFDEQLVNAALVVVLVTLVIAPLGTARFAGDVRVEAAPRRRPGERPLVPVTDGTSVARARLAARMASAEGGVVVLLAVADDGQPTSVTAARERLIDAERAVAGLGAEHESLLRIADDLGTTVLGVATEEDASVVVASFSATGRALDRLFGSPDEALVRASSVPILAVSPGEDEPGRVVLALSRSDLRGGRADELGVAITAARALAHALGGHPTVLAPHPEKARPVLSGLEQVPVEGYDGSRADAVAEAASGADVVVVPARIARGALGAIGRGLGRVASQPTIVVAAAPADEAGAWDAPGTRAIAGVR
jgi:Kef-type K+ transport system membrane component KefB